MAKLLDSKSVHTVMRGLRASKAEQLNNGDPNFASGYRAAMDDVDDVIDRMNGVSSIFERAANVIKARLDAQQFAWNQLKEEIDDLRRSNDDVAVREFCKFLLNYMKILEEDIDKEVCI